MTLPPPLDTEAFVKNVLETLVASFLPRPKVLTAYGPETFLTLPCVLATVLPGPVEAEGLLERLVVDVDVVAADRASSVRIALDVMRALGVAWRSQRVFTHGWLADFDVLQRPFRADSTGSNDTVRRLGDPKGTVRHTARYVLTVRPR